MKLSYLSALILVPAFILTGLNGGGYQLYHTIKDSPKDLGVCKFIPAAVPIPSTIKPEGKKENSSITCDGTNMAVVVTLMPAGTPPPEIPGPCSLGYYEDPKALILFDRVLCEI